MDQDLNNRQTDFLRKLLANPADKGHLYSYDLLQLIEKFPQSGLLQAMLARANNGEGIHHAATSFDPKALYVLLNASHTLEEVSPEQIIQKANSVAHQEAEVGSDHFSNEGSDFEQIIELEPEAADKVVVGEDERYEVDHLGDQTTTEHIQVISDIAHKIETPAEDNKLETQFAPFEEEVIELPNQGEEIVDEEAALMDSQADHAVNHDIEDDVYDEIVGIENIRLANGKKQEQGTPEDEPAEEKPDEETDHSREYIGRLISENLAASDYFGYKRAERTSERPAIEEESSAFISGHEEPFIEGKLPHEGDTQEVSKYHDEKMPYTFMWWLDKTRKEHAGIYQPFKLDITEVIKQAGDDTLQQQYYENIFHITSLEELDRSTAPKKPLEFDAKSREDRIIQKFIAQDPQINPPSSDKLDTENKARKSSEEHDVFVTETLARVYVEQMLYHKAINTYKKLMLKFPEKSRYFADQIELLEKKIN